MNQNTIINPNTELRGYLLDAYRGMGYTLFRLPPTGQHRVLDDAVRVDSPRQLFVGREYMALPFDFAKREPFNVLESMVAPYAGLRILANIFRITPKGVVVQDIGANKEREFNYFEFITAVERLPNLNGVQENGKRPKSPNHSRL